MGCSPGSRKESDLTEQEKSIRCNFLKVRYNVRSDHISVKFSYIVILRFIFTLVNLFLMYNFSSSTVDHWENIDSLCSPI